MTETTTQALYDFGDGLGPVPAAQSANGAWVALSAWVGACAKVGVGATVGDGATVGVGARVGAYATVEADATVNAGARVEAVNGAAGELALGDAPTKGRDAIREGA